MPIEEFEYLRKEAEAEGLDFGFKKISAADDYTAALMNDGALYVWGKNDNGHLGVGSGIGIDMVESERIPKEVEFEQALPSGTSGPVFIEDFSAG